MSVVDALLAEYRLLSAADDAAKRAMASAERLFHRIDHRTKLGEDRAYALAGVHLADCRSVAAARARHEALERMIAFDRFLLPRAELSVNRVMVWATATGAHLSCVLSDEHADIAKFELRPRGLRDRMKDRAAA